MNRISSARRGVSAAVFSVVAVLASAASSRAVVETDFFVNGGLPTKLFESHMILQRDQNARVWGTADVGEHVTVTIASQTKETDADGSGRWLVTLDPVAAGGPYVLTIQGASNQLVYDDVMFGDVFVMAGQSNLMIKRPFPGKLLEAPNARVFKRTWHDRPGGMPFSVAKVLNEDLGVPVAILQCAMRGSSGISKTWIGTDGFVSSDPVAQEIIDSGNYGQSYELAIKPVTGLAIKGIIWWQGESDTRSRNDPGTEYAHVLPAIIQSWRQAFGQPNLPFLFVQEPVGGGMLNGTTVPEPLPDANYTPQQSGNFRQAFVKSLKEPNTTLITNADLLSGLHPKDRDDYRDRIEVAVLARVYGENIIYAGPTFQSYSIEDGNKVRIKFRTNTANGLTTRNVGPVQGFSISGDGQTFTWANAEIQGEEVVVWSDDVANPTVVRYGYHKEYKFANLANAAGMGMPTFTTEAEPAPE